jgi:hypothetical protein
VNCSVIELLPTIESGAQVVHCADLPSSDAYSLSGVETIRQADGTTAHRELCRVRQVGRAGAGTRAGWAYDDGNAALGTWSTLRAGCTQRIGFSLIDPVPGAEIRLQCAETILPSTTASVQLGDFCDPSTGLTTSSQQSCAMGHAVAGNPATLTCDPFTRACAVPCTSSSDCTAAGLLSYVCDTRTADAVFGAAIPSGIHPSQVHDFCVNPTCGGPAS